MIRKRIILLFLPIISLTFYSFRFAFDDKKGDKYIIFHKTEQEVIQSNTTKVTLLCKHQAELNVISESQGKALIKGVFNFSFNQIHGSTVLRNSGSDHYDSEFQRDRLGKMTISDKYYYPVSRDIPVLPDRDISIGFTWENESEEAQDFRKLGIQKPYRYKLKSKYKYVSDTLLNNENHAVIDFSQIANAKTPNEILNSTYHSLPSQIFGRNTGKIYWNKQRNFCALFIYDYDHTFIFANGNTMNFKGICKTEINKIGAIQSSQTTLIRRLNETIQTNRIPVHISRSPNEIRINFQGNVLFPFSSWDLTSDIKLKLKKIAKILKEFSKKNTRIRILIAGHSDSIGKQERKKLFSNKRAQAVAIFLIQEGIESSRISFHGFSDSKPEASNDTAEGRDKNRRVEIIIQTQ